MRLFAIRIKRDGDFYRAVPERRGAKGQIIKLRSYEGVAASAGDAVSRVLVLLGVAGVLEQ